MVGVLKLKMKFLLGEKNRLEDELSRTSNMFVKRRKILDKFITEIDKDIEILECDIINLRSELVSLGFNPDISLEDKNIDEIEREYDILMNVGFSFAPELGPLGIQYAIDDRKEMLALALLDMFYIKGDNMTRVDSRKTKRKRRI